MYVCVLCVPGAHGCQKRALNPLKVEVQMVVSCPVWVLAIKARPSLREQQVLLTVELCQAHFVMRQCGMVGSSQWNKIICLMAREQEKDRKRAQDPTDPFKATLQEDAKV